MKFSTRTRYGLRFLINLASCPEGELMQLNELAKEENISAGYLEQIVRSLRPLGIIRSVRGAAGGYALSCKAEKICMEQVFLHLEGNISPVACINNSKHCKRIDTCTTHNFWKALDDTMRSFLRGVTLRDVMVMYAADKNNIVK